MAKDLSTTKWHGVPRQEIPWFPIVTPDACIGCELCYVTCGREVYEIDIPDGKHRIAVAERPLNCMVGCSTCAMVCPTEAITFPDREVVWEVEKQHKIFKQVHKEAVGKREKQAVITSGTADSSPEITRQTVQIAGLFGEKRFLVKLENFIENRPYDIENLQLTVPTLKGLLQQAPAFMRFEVTSTDQRDVQSFLEELKALAKENDLTWVEEAQKLTTENK